MEFPVNLGPDINSAANEYRPVLGVDLKFENHFLIFSSDRPGGKGGYDLISHRNNPSALDCRFLFFAGLQRVQQQ
jgi:hypothetical protein